MIETSSRWNFLRHLPGPAFRAVAFLGRDGSAFAAGRNVGRHQRLANVHITAPRTGDVAVLSLLVVGAAISKPSLKFMAIGAAELIDDHALNTLFSRYIDTHSLYLLINAKEYND